MSSFVFLGERRDILFLRQPEVQYSPQYSALQSSASEYPVLRTMRWIGPQCDELPIAGIRVGLTECRVLTADVQSAIRERMRRLFLFSFLRREDYWLGLFVSLGLRSILR